jgi:hypothetical protein
MPDYPKLIVTGISEDRFARYKDAADGANLKPGLGRYMHNLSLCEALYPTLSAFEVGLRNGVHRALTVKRGTEFWMDDAGFLRPTELEKVAHARAELTRLRKSPLTAPRIVAALSFGFWTGIFNQYYWTKLGGVTRAVFPCATVLPTLKSLNDDLREIRILRNRIYHYEPIWDSELVAPLHNKMHSYLEWMNSDWRYILDPINRFVATQTQTYTHYEGLLP